MNSKQSQFSFFIATAARDLSSDERETVYKLLEHSDPAYSEQVNQLRVVGRCGCGECPTVFFEPDEPGVEEQDLSTYAGTDKEGGIVAVVLMQKRGRLSQLEFYSVDGHHPWSPPQAEALEPYK